MKRSMATSICRTTLRHADRVTTTTAAIRCAAPYSTFTNSSGEEEQISFRMRRPRVNKYSDPKNPKNIAIIGGGITGLSTAHYLAKYAAEGTKITIYDGADRWGGWLNTQYVRFNDANGKEHAVRFETGPRTLRSYAKDTWKMDDLVLYDLLRDINLEPVFRPGGTRYIAFGKELVALTPKNLLIHPKLRGIWPAALKALLHMRRRTYGSFEKSLFAFAYFPEDIQDSSVADAFREMTGGSLVADQLVSAIMHGVWGGDIDRLSFRYAFPKLHWNLRFSEGRPDHVHMPEHEAQLLKAALADEHIVDMVKRSRKGQLLMFADGMEALPRAIVDGLSKNPNVTFKGKTRIEKVDYSRKADKVVLTTTDNKSTAYDKVISTVYSGQLNHIAPELETLKTSDAATITAVNVWLPVEGLNAPHRGLGYLCPRNDGGFHDAHGLLGVFFDSDALVRPEGETPGTKLFVLFRGVVEQTKALMLTSQILQTHLGIDPEIQKISITTESHNCIPQQMINHKSRMERADQEINEVYHGRLAVAGPSYSGTGVVGSIRAGHDVAAHVAGGNLDHIGSTGLGQFLQTAMPLLEAVPRKDLIALGRQIPEQTSWWARMLRGTGKFGN